eukprot:GFUD01132533.1.p1 GENE.GFUD01132533.1~~GFUD01132533.1.p1  ORF type:complete len:522 (-),score=129.92 GFUD01132533.1:691-2256(-)
MMQDIPCRDTDPDPYMASTVQDEDRASPLAFTVHFGGKDNLEEKQKKLERFALRSSQRKPQSPRGNAVESDQLMKTRSKTKAKMTMGEPCGDDIRLAQTGAKPFLRQKSDLARERHNYRRRTIIISPGKEVINFSSEPNNENYSRMNVKPTFTDNGATLHSQEKNEKDYDEDTFDSDSDDNEKNVKHQHESDPSETGTYTVDKEDESPGLQETRDELESLIERNQDKSSYVEEWASKHSFPQTSLEPLSPRDAFSPEGTKSSLISNKSRRMLPATPNSHPTRSPDVLTFSPDSEPGSSLTPPNLPESDDDDSSYVTHTQHLVDVMEERIKQKSNKKVETRSTTTVSRNTMIKSKSKNTKNDKGAVKSPEPIQDAMEAWKRRKNYDPMVAAGRKKGTESVRKHSASSSKSGVRSPHNPANSDTIENESYHKGPMKNSISSKQSAPSSATSRSSKSSGYLSRGGEKSKQSEREPASYTARTAPVPLRKLVHTNSTSSLKVQSNRSTSSLTSNEAEFQAWKRRK